MFRTAAAYNQNINVDEFVMSVSGYIQKCMENITVIRNITTWANHKPWITAEVQAMLKARNATFKSGDLVALKTARANLDCATRQVKRAYGQKIQVCIQHYTNTRNMWEGIQPITNYKACQMSCKDDMDFLNELNYHFGRSILRTGTVF